MALIHTIDSTTPPVACSVAYKEWAGVCRALGEGRQTVLLRKGGISEGPGGFRPEYPAFWLYPTHLHEAQQGLRDETPPARVTTPDGFLDLDLLAVVDALAWVDRAEELDALDEFHVWTDETVQKRFSYRSRGLWVLGVRIYRRDPAARIAITPDQAGCKTWVPLEFPVDANRVRAILRDEDAILRRDALLARLRTR
jgi:hypothetical protein